MKKLLLLLSFMVFTGLFSCSEDVEYLINTKFYYSNQTDYVISMKIYNSDAELLMQNTIQPLNSASFAILAEGGAGPFQYNSNDSQIGDSIYIAFGEERYMICERGSHEIFNSDSYVFTKESKTEYLFNYTFTNDHFENATIIEE